MHSHQKNEYTCSHSSICNNLPYPFACHKVLSDKNSDACSYIFIEANKAFEDIFGLQKEDVIGKSLTEFIKTKDYSDSDWINAYNKAIITDDKCIFKLFSEHSRKWYSVSVFKCSEGHLLTMFYDITDIISNTNHYDELTGLYSRSCFKEYLDKLDSDGTLPISVIIGDVNGLKTINNSFGYSQGDSVLKNMAKILKQNAHDKDMVARISGDEFAIIIPGGGEKEASEACDKIRESLKKTVKYSSYTSMALGYALKAHSSQNIGDVIKKAEDRMYKNKLSEGISIRSSLVNSLRKTLEERTLETEEHAFRIRNLAVNLGDILCLSESTRDELALLAILHDIGKIGIPDKILLKPGPLAQHEWKVMKTHCEIGYRIASTSTELNTVAKGILSHHEHWNGEGYPHGLKGEEIPLTSRIVSVADAYDAMTNDRPYRNALSKKEALREIRRCSGKQFDPHIVKTFLKMVSK